MGRSYIRPRKRRSKPKIEGSWLRRSYQTFEVPATGDAYSEATNVVVAITCPASPRSARGRAQSGPFGREQTNLGWPRGEAYRRDVRWARSPIKCAHRPAGLAAVGSA